MLPKHQAESPQVLQTTLLWIILRQAVPVRQRRPQVAEAYTQAGLHASHNLVNHVII